MSRRSRLPALARTAALAFLAAGPLLRADDDKNPALKPPPGYKLIYEDVGGKQVPVFVQQQLDPLRHAGTIMSNDPLDHQKVFSESNAFSHKTYFTGENAQADKTLDDLDHETFPTKVYNATSPSTVYNIGTKSTFRTTPYNGLNAAHGYDKSFATRGADITPVDDAAAAFAAIGTPDEQNRTAPIQPKPIDVFAAPMAHKTALTAAADNTVHHNVGELGNGTPLTQLPDRPLTIDEVKNLINHGFKPDFSQPPGPASKPLNDPNYQPTPLRISPADAENPDNNGSDNTPRPNKAFDDDKDDPVPSPGMMAQPPPVDEPLPRK